MESPLSREQWQEALLELVETMIPALPAPDLQADFDAALRTAQSRLAGDLLAAWMEQQEMEDLEPKPPVTTGSESQ